MTGNPEPIALWVAALRSGEYPQSKSRLRTNLGYCCLGVACEVALRHGVQMHVEVFSCNDDEAMAGVTHQWEYNGYEGYLPEPVRDWLGLPEMFGDVDVRTAEGKRELAKLNDIYDWSFAEIAGAIEYTYLTPEGNQQ